MFAWLGVSVTTNSKHKFTCSQSWFKTCVWIFGVKWRLSHTHAHTHAHTHCLNISSSSKQWSARFGKVKGAAQHFHRHTHRKCLLHMHSGNRLAIYCHCYRILIQLSLSYIWQHHFIFVWFFYFSSVPSLKVSPNESSRHLLASLTNDLFYRLLSCWGFCYTQLQDWHRSDWRQTRVHLKGAERFISLKR